MVHFGTTVDNDLWVGGANSANAIKWGPLATLFTSILYSVFLVKIKRKKKEKKIV